MKDLLVLAITFGSVPLIVWRPWIGIIMWVWLSVMNPHRLGYGVAADWPLAAIVAGVTMMALLVRPVPKRFPLTAVTVFLLAFVFWMNVTTHFSLVPDVPEQWNRVMKVMLMTFVTLILIRDRHHVQALIWIIVISLGFYGVKGGIFTILTGGKDKVWGPPLSSIADNNEIALALVMTIPLMHYLQTTTKSRTVRYALSGAMLLCFAAILGTYSRGALLAMGLMVGVLALRSHHKAGVFLFILAVLPFAFNFMPAEWMARMEGIHLYEQDGSAMGRINAWTMAYNLALDHPLVGGGFQIYLPELFAIYAPNPDDLHVAHSIYFQALGEHGFVGLGLVLLYMLATWRCANWIIRHAAGSEQYRWARSLASMLQVSLLGYAAGGAFLSLLYLDVPYFLMAALVATRALMEREMSAKARDDAAMEARNGGATPEPAWPAARPTGARLRIGDRRNNPASPGAS
ncbi:putative O-glycosylation ligase, exosortase A system-associated [Lacisediminimonas profundi]|uniref:putative O-glycosylation ligase, exosortase A system-associated n=1 Tax=Lacisediminimonas profundi TaxID=2603856 RepID=UPI00124B4D5E|nr:putative O-glycosylation ligase, exosortase A system-associated [Lacisediminimonas profundi]